MTDFLNALAEAIDQMLWNIEQSYNLLLYYFDNLEFLISFGKIYIIGSSIVFALMLMLMIIVIVNQATIKQQIEQLRSDLIETEDEEEDNDN